MTGVAPNSIVFADRPVRAAGHDLTSRIVEDWSKGSDNFAQDPPNATVSGFSKDGARVKDAVVVLKNPKLEGDRLTFDVDVLEGDLAGADGAASLFIDIIGRPLTPLSFAGVARRTAFRGAYYAGAAAVGAAAIGAAAYYHPYAAAAAYGYGYPPPPVRRADITRIRPATERRQLRISRARTAVTDANVAERIADDRFREPIPAWSSFPAARSAWARTGTIRRKRRSIA